MIEIEPLETFERQVVGMHSDIVDFVYFVKVFSPSERVRLVCY